MSEILIDEQEKEDAMPMTHLFVELLVIGFGAELWVVIFAAALFGYPGIALSQGSQSLWVLPPLLYVAYVLGILIDRVADWIFERWDRRHLKVCFGNDREGYYEARRMLVVHGAELWGHLEYGRTRMRICRGWALNAVLLLVAVDVFAWVQHPPALTWRNLVVMNLALLLLGLLCATSWSTLTRKEYQKIQRQSVWISKMRRKEGRSVTAVDRQSTEIVRTNIKEEESDVGGDQEEDVQIPGRARSVARTAGVSRRA